jgi:hypothetical protein
MDQRGDIFTETGGSAKATIAPINPPPQASWKVSFPDQLREQKTLALEAFAQVGE